MRFAIALLAVSALSAQTHWEGTWGAAPAPQLDAAAMKAQKLAFQNQTLREIIHTSIGGDTVRVRLSNAFGPEPVEIGAAHIALRSTGAAINASTDHALTFSGRPRVEIPAGGVVLSDPVKLPVPAAGDVAVSLYLPKNVLGAGVHYSSQQTSYIATGDVTGAAALSNPETFTSWAFLTGLDVLAPAAFCVEDPGQEPPLPRCRRGCGPADQLADARHSPGGRRSDRRYRSSLGRRGGERESIGGNALVRQI